MLFHKTKEIQDKINEYAQHKEPFLFAVNFDLTEGFFIGDPLQQSEVLFEVNGIGNIDTSNRGIPPVQFSCQPIAYEEYEKKFNIVRKALLRGDSYLTNLTIKTPVDMNLSLSEVARYSIAPYKLLLPDRFVCFSPERFVKIEGNTISTNPMKGTIDASLPDAEQTILNDFKETAEHSTIVDLLRNDLSIVADNVKVERFRYVDRIATNMKDILQVSSEITGTLQGDVEDNLGDIIFGLLPAGSISGAPKDATLRIISEAENETRGYYTGVFGYYDGTTLDTAVLIRYIEKDRNNYYFRSGGGVTAYSDCESEYKEFIDKIYLPIR